MADTQGGLLVLRPELVRPTRALRWAEKNARQAWPLGCSPLPVVILLSVVFCELQCAAES